MKKYLTTFLIFFVSISCTPKADFLVLSNKIYQLNFNDKSRLKKKKIELERKARINAYRADSKSFLTKPINDTVFIAQGYNSESGVLFNHIWDTKHDIIY